MLKFNGNAKICSLFISTMQLLSSAASNKNLSVWINICLVFKKEKSIFLGYSLQKNHYLYLKCAAVSGFWTPLSIIFEIDSQSGLFCVFTILHCDSPFWSNALLCKFSGHPFKFIQLPKRRNVYNFSETLSSRGTIFVLAILFYDTQLYNIRHPRIWFQKFKNQLYSLGRISRNNISVLAISSRLIIWRECTL
jgi:hypothetical protein